LIEVTGGASVRGGNLNIAHFIGGSFQQETILLERVVVIPAEIDSHSQGRQGNEVGGSRRRRVARTLVEEDNKHLQLSFFSNLKSPAPVWNQGAGPPGAEDPAHQHPQCWCIRMNQKPSPTLEERAGPPGRRKLPD